MDGRGERGRGGRRDGLIIVEVVFLLFCSRCKGLGIPSASGRISESIGIDDTRSKDFVIVSAV